MKERKFREYLYIGVTAVLVIVACIVLVFMFIKWDSVQAGIKGINNILAPITYGAILAYLLTPVYNRSVRGTEKLLKKRLAYKKGIWNIGKIVGTTVSLVVLFAVVIGLFWMLMPQLVRSVMGIINALPANAEKVAVWIESTFASNPEMETMILDLYNQGITKLIEWSKTELVPSLELIIGGVFNGVISVVGIFTDAMIGVIVMVYLLNIKDTLCAQAKKGIYSFFTLSWANEIIEKFRFAHRVFGGFIIGKLIDSAIIGVICFLLFSLFKMPYVLLISVIIGVTNIIPFFGPFIGAIPSAILILLVSPSQCLYFIGLIFLIQQFDGNILGPKILGESTGLSSFWVLFSILVFGGILGPVGMIIGVPLFAVIYRLASERVATLLKRKNLSDKTEDYGRLDHIDEASRAYISMDPPIAEGEKGQS